MSYLVLCSRTSDRVRGPYPRISYVYKPKRKKSLSQKGRHKQTCGASLASHRPPWPWLEGEESWECSCSQSPGPASPEVRPLGLVHCLDQLSSKWDYRRKCQAHTQDTDRPGKPLAWTSPVTLTQKGDENQGDPWEGRPPKCSLDSGLGDSGKRQVDSTEADRLPHWWRCQQMLS